jgi:hypothetical protein
MNLKIIVPLIVIFCLACGDENKPVPSQDAHAQALSNHIVSISSYEIPRGIFRGVLWPDSKENNFIIWIIDKQKELYFQIPAPSEFIDYQDRTADWDIKLIDSQKNKITYVANKKSKMKSIQLELPRKKRAYVFYVLKNATGDEMLVFMDTSETVIDKKGLFGYVIIK